jgi:hypothetical protein
MVKRAEKVVTADQNPTHQEDFSHFFPPPGPCFDET